MTDPHDSEDLLQPQSRSSPNVPTSRVLVVEDEAGVREVLGRVLGRAGYQVVLVPTGEEALQQMAQGRFEVVLLDLSLPGIGGMALLSAGPTLLPEAEFVVLTGSESVESAVEALQLGAHSYLRKPVAMAELLVVIARATEEAERHREVTALRASAGTDVPGTTLIGRAPAMRRLDDLIIRVAPSRASVLIIGETGTGKELVARRLHLLSPRARFPFIGVQCSALAEPLLESELFGHVKGSFTGAVTSRPGMFEVAGAGTLFLDEVDTLSLASQVKLLRVLQERQVQRVGSNSPIPVGFRLLAATNADLEEKVARGEFRQDLYFRLNAFPITVPPLRDRASDIPTLASFFLARAAAEQGVEAPAMSDGLVTRLVRHPWPGNVRELEHFIERLVLLYSGRKVIPADAAVWSPTETLLGRASKAQWTLDELERHHILQILGEEQGAVVASAKRLGISRRTLTRKLNAYRKAGLLPPEPTAE